MTSTSTTPDAVSAGVDPVVQLQGITVEFPPVVALDHVDFRLLPGEIHALMGENGAGKSTLIKALTGVYSTTSGAITVDGTPRQFSGPGDAQDAGISTVYQEVNLCRNLTVAENIMLGHEVHRGPFVNWPATRRRSREFLSRLNLDLDPASILGTHSIAVQQLVAICRAMVVDARVLILDEPTSSLDPGEVEQLFAVLRTLRQEGVAILFVSHFIDQVFAISDRMTILRNGKLVGEYRTEELERLDLVSRMIGDTLQELEDIQEHQVHTVEDVDSSRDTLLQADDLGRRGSVEPYDLVVRRGEVVGLAGLLGSGRSEVARLLCGADRPDHGTLALDGTTVRLRTPRAGLDHGVAYASEDRKRDGVVGELTIRENIVLGMQARRGWIKPLPRRRVDEVVDKYIAALDIRPTNPEARMNNLSGGNQQKVLLARWLAMDPSLVILDEPTRGIDIGAKTEIQRLVAELADGGMGVVFISAELEEVVRLSHRIVIMHDRRKVNEVVNTAEVSVDDLIGLIARGGDDPDAADGDHGGADGAVAGDADGRAEGVVA